MNTLKSFNNKKILITGHTGFKGSWLTLWLLKYGARIMGISDKIPTKPSLYDALKLKKKIIDVQLDIRNSEKLNININKFKPDYIFHFAAQALVKKSYKYPVQTFCTNAIGTLNLLETLRTTKIKKKIITIIITSDKSYKNIEKKKSYVETDILGGYDPYSASKASAELIINSYFESFLKNKKNILIGIARAGNVVGGGDWSEDRLVPDCIRSWKKNEKVTIRNPKSTRPWQHVLEALFGYLTFANKLKDKKKLNGEVFNFGPNNKSNHTVEELVLEIKKFWKNIKWKIKKDNTNLESKLLKINSDKAKKYLKWKCILSFSVTTKFIADWYLNYYNNKKNIFLLSLKQIEIYEKNLKIK
jgi:CDP-glucose 4,6-dehydratase